MKIEPKTSLRSPRTSASRYVVIPRTLIFLTCGDKLLLLHGSPHKRLWANKYNGIGGHIEAGETPVQSALRELEEETGLRGVDLNLRGVIHVTLPTPPGIMIFVFVGQVAAPKALRASDEGTPVWVSRDRLPTLPLVEDLPQLLPRILSPGPMVFGHYVFSETGDVEISFVP